MPDDKPLSPSFEKVLATGGLVFRWPRTGHAFLARASANRFCALRLSPVATATVWSWSRWSSSDRPQHRPPDVRIAAPPARLTRFAAMWAPRSSQESPVGHPWRRAAARAVGPNPKAASCPDLICEETTRIVGGVGTTMEADAAGRSSAARSPPTSNRLLNHVRVFFSRTASAKVRELHRETYDPRRCPTSNGDRDQSSRYSEHG